MPLEQDIERIEYLDAFGELGERDFDTYVESYKQRVLSAARDIYGEESPEMQFFISVMTTGKPEFYEFEKVQYSIPSLIRADAGERLGFNIVGYLRNVFRDEREFLLDESLYHFWEQLAFAGMSHENIGKYFERFEEVY